MKISIFNVITNVSLTENKCSAIFYPLVGNRALPCGAIHLFASLFFFSFFCKNVSKIVLLVLDPSLFYYDCNSSLRGIANGHSTRVDKMLFNSPSSLCSSCCLWICVHVCAWLHASLPTEIGNKFIFNMLFLSIDRWNECSSICGLVNMISDCCSGINYHWLNSFVRYLTV